MPLEELEHRHPVHPGEGARRHRREQRGVQPRDRPHRPLPAIHERRIRLPAARRIRARGAVAHGRLPASEPAGVLVAGAHRDRELPTLAGLDMGGAPVGAARLVRVLAVLAHPILAAEHPPRAPPAAHPLPLDRAERIGGEAHLVVLVRLEDRAGGVDLQEVHRDVQVLGGQVREAVRGHLIAHRELVPQVLHAQLPLRLRLPQEVQGTALGQQQRAGQIVRLHPLAQQLSEVRRLLLAQHMRGDRLQHRGARIRGGPPQRQVDPPVLRIGDRAGGVGQVGHRMEGEAELRGQQRHLPVGQRPAPVPDPREQVPGRLLERGIVVARPGLLLAQLTVHPPRLLRGRGPLLMQSPQLPVQGEDRLDRGVGQGLAHRQLGQREGPVQRPRLRRRQRDLERRAMVRRLGIQQVVHRHLERPGDAAQLPELQLALAVLDHRQLRGRALDRGRELGQGHAPLLPTGADAPPDQQRVEVVVGSLAGRHLIVSHAHTVPQRSSAAQKYRRSSSNLWVPGGLRAPHSGTTRGNSSRAAPTESTHRQHHHHPRSRS